MKSERELKEEMCESCQIPFSKCSQPTQDRCWAMANENHDTHGFMARVGQGTYSGAMQAIINKQDKDIAVLRAKLAKIEAALLEEREAHSNCATDYGMLAEAIGGDVADHSGNMIKARNLKESNDAL